MIGDRSRRRPMAHLQPTSSATSSDTSTPSASQPVKPTGAEILSVLDETAGLTTTLYHTAIRAVEPAAVVPRWPAAVSPCSAEFCRRATPVNASRR